RGGAEDGCWMLVGLVTEDEVRSPSQAEYSVLGARYAASGLVVPVCCWLLAVGCRLSAVRNRTARLRPGTRLLARRRGAPSRRIVKPNQVFNRIHVEDIGRVTALAAQRKLAGTFNLADD